MSITSRVCLLFLTMTACTSGSNNSITQSDEDSVTIEVRQALENYYTDIAARGLVAEFDYLDSSSNFFWVPPGANVALSYDSIHQLIALNANAFTSVVNTWDTLQVTPLSSDHAMYTGRLQSVMTDTAGHVTTYRLVETGIVIRRENKWKLLSGQTAVIP